MLDPKLRAEIKDIPDFGWQDSYGEDTYCEIAERMVAYGMDSATVGLLLQRLYWATRNEFH